MRTFITTAILIALTSSVSAEATSSGKWSLTERTDALTDNRVLALVLLADEADGRGERPSLAIRCTSSPTGNKTEMFISWGTFINTEPTKVSIRIGNDPATGIEWSISANHTATFYPSDVPRFVEQMGKANRFIAQVKPYSDNPITAIFDSTGLTAVAKPLSDACSWKVKPLFP